MKSDREIMQTIHAAIDDCTGGIDEAPSLRYRIARKTKGEETVVKKISATAILIIALIAVTMTAALAAALHSWGIVDFAGRHANTYVPPKYEDSITRENVKLETDSVSCTIQQSYYDGKILRLTANIAPKKDVLLIGDDDSLDVPISDLISGVADDKTTVAEYALAYYGGRIARIARVDLRDAKENCDFRLNEDGSMSYYSEWVFEDEMEERSVDLNLICLCGTVEEAPAQTDEEGRGGFSVDYAAKESAVLPMTFRSVPVKRFISDEPLDFPGAGVQVKRVSLTVTPLEIRYAIDYAISDPERYARQEGGLWFEFIDPDSTESEYCNQRVSDGLTAGGSVERLDGRYDLPEEEGTVYRQTESIGLNALSNRYTIRAFNAWEKTRYEAVTFEVKETD